MTKMSVFSPKSRDERGIFPKYSLLFAPIPPGEGCKSSIREREEIRVRPNGGIGVTGRWEIGPSFFAQKNIEKMSKIELQKYVGKNLGTGGCLHYAQISRGARSDLLSIPSGD